MGRAPCCDKANVKKGPWSPEEDATLKSYIEDHGPVGNWIALPQKIGLKRCGKSCRLRWLNYLRPNIKHGGFSEEEDKIICSLYISIGSRWSIIAAQLPGRTDNDIKNYWNTKLKKKLLGKQRNKEHQIRRSSSMRDHSTKTSPKNENFSVISGAADEYWSREVPGEVNSLPLTCMNQNPSLIGNQASMRELLTQLGGLRSPPYQEEETSPINSYFLDYPNDMIPTNYCPFDRSMLLASSRPSDQVSFKGSLTAGYGMSRVDNIIPVDINNIMLPDFSLDGGPHKSNSVYGAGEMIVNGSVCSSGLSNIICEGSSMIWEDISSLLACPPLLCDYELANNNSQSLGGGLGRGTGDSSFEESRLYVGQC